MNIVFENDRPIYLQLVEILRLQIISGALKQGEKLPSVRELALIMKVNPNTIQKALFELESQKLIHTERTNGKYVTQNQKLIDKVKTELAKEKVSNYLEDMNKIGIDKEEAIKYLTDLGGN